MFSHQDQAFSEVRGQGCIQSTTVVVYFVLMCCACSAYHLFILSSLQELMYSGITAHGRLLSRVRSLASTLGLLSLLCSFGFWAPCRWGDSRSPAYGTLSDYQFMRPHTSRTTRKQKALEAWGSSLSSLEDIIAVFVKFVSGDRLTHKPYHTLAAAPHISTTSLQSCSGSSEVTEGAAEE